MDNSWRTLEPTDQDMEAKSIRSWMFAHIEEHVDPKTGEVNCTGLAEECALALYPGEWLPETHIVWDEAVDVAEVYEKDRCEVCNSRLTSDQVVYQKHEGNLHPEQCDFCAGYYDEEV